MLNKSRTQEAWQMDQRRSRPWLLPFNRRLRHLNGIILRNLSAKDTAPSKLPTALDDEALPQTLSSPAKTLAKQERRQLERSHSSTELLSIADESSPKTAATEPNIDSETAMKTPSRPIKRMRRRSTLDWQNASPAARQRRFEALTSSQLMDVFFSIHIEEEEDPIYVSEAVEKTMNPVFESFSLSGTPGNISRLDNLTIRIWTRGEGKHKFQHLLELKVDLPSLRFVGKSLADLRYPLPSNSVFFTLTDGIYIMPSEGILFPPLPQAETSRKSNTLVLPTSSYDALMRLSTLDVCVQDALATRDRLEAEMHQLLEAHKNTLGTVRSVPMTEDHSSLVEQSVSTERRRLEAARRRCDTLRTSIKDREAFMSNDRERQAKTKLDMTEQHTHTCAMKEAHTQTTEDIRGQRRRICEQLERVYPIEPLPNKPLSFTIRGMYMPNSVFDDVDEAEISAALGYVAQMVKLLSFYLSTPLPYEPSPQGSSSTIEDLISATTASSIYPLFMKGTPRFRFEYGVFLLNKDIEIMSDHLGLRVIDPRQMLPNLKYLFYVATAGSSELPMRKAGGLRAFLHIGPGSSRRGSVGSTMSQQRPLLGSSASADGEYSGGTRPTAAESLKVGLAIRTKENGVITGVESRSTIKTSKLRNVS